MISALGARRALLVAAATTATTVLVVPAAGTVGAVADPNGTVFINELHYDNVGTDAGEFIEVAAPAGTDLTGWSIVLYNGANGDPYDTDALGGVVPDQGGGFGTVAVNYAVNGIQNGAPDGLALVDPSGTVVQFLSYEGQMRADSGVASGLASTDIGVAESGSEPAGGSLALTGTGGTYGAFAWTVATNDTPGTPNPGQTFDTSGPAQPIATCPATLTTMQGTAASAQVSASDADSDIALIEITSAPVDGITLSDAGVAGAANLDVAATTAPGSYDVVIQFTTADDQTDSCTVSVIVEAAAVDVFISEVQGDGASSPLNDQDVIVEGIVTSLFTSQDVLDGLFVQEEDADADDSAATSEGVFVFCRGSCPTDVAAGDLVEVAGEVDEFFGMTQIVSTSAVGGSISIVSSGHPLPTATAVSLPAGGSTRAAATFESVEGMVAVFPGTLVVSEYFELARYGQLVLTADEVPYQFTHNHAPNVEGYAAHLADLATRRIILDDDNNDQNDAISHTLNNEPYPYPSHSWPAGGLALNHRFRVGDSTTGLTGVMHWSFAGQSGTDAWRIRPIPGEDYSFESENPAPAEPEDVGGTLKVATFNVLNYFTTVDTTSSNSEGNCGPSGNLDCRGADSHAELERQRAKIVAALEEMDADVVGLIEIQNDAGASTADLAAALNATPGGGQYAVIDTGTIGTDAIKVALIYQPADVTPVGEFVILDSSVDPRFLDQKNRPVLIQTFEQVGTGERFTVAVNHFKSKGSNCNDVNDPDQLDGQGNCPDARTAASQALADYLATDPTGSGDPDFLILGDLNSYRRETPITTLIDAGYTDLIEHFIGDDAYSYLFDGQLGYLDHALATESLAGQVTGVTEWAINADEVPLFDYNDTVLDPGEASFERESSALPLYAPDPFRSSDHNPLLVGLDLESNNTLTVRGASIIVSAFARRVVLSGQVAGETFTTCPRVALRVDGGLVLETVTTPVGESSRCAGRAANGTVTFDRATGAIGLTATLPTTFTLADDTVNFELMLDGETFAADVTGRRLGPLWVGPAG